MQHVCQQLRFRCSILTAAEMRSRLHIQLFHFVFSNTDLSDLRKFIWLLAAPSGGLFVRLVNWPFKNWASPHTHPLLFTSASLHPPFSLSPSSLLTHLSIISIPSPPSSRPRALTYPSRSAAAVTGGQEVKAKVECHTHRVTVMPGCCVSLWMESSECQTRWPAPDALILAWACPFPSRGHVRGPVLTAPPVPPGHHRYCCNGCH